LYVATITQNNVAVPASPSESEVFEQDRALFTDKWKAAVNCGIWTILSR